jgi:hypothetical protein
LIQILSINRRRLRKCGLLSQKPPALTEIAGGLQAREGAIPSATERKRREFGPLRLYPAVTLSETGWKTLASSMTIRRKLIAL